VANIIIPQIVVVDPTGAFPAAFAPGESLLLQRSPAGLVVGIYNYSGGAAPIAENRFTAPAASTAETRALSLLSTVRGLVWV